MGHPSVIYSLSKAGHPSVIYSLSKAGLPGASYKANPKQASPVQPTANNQARRKVVNSGGLSSQQKIFYGKKLNPMEYS